MQSSFAAGEGHGRIERRPIAARDLPKGMLTFRHARQAFRVRRRRVVAKTSNAAEQAGPTPAGLEPPPEPTVPAGAFGRFPGESPWEHLLTR